jgi:hypothetical protein
MRKFDNDILPHLNQECKGEAIHFVGLGAYDFQLSFGGLVRIQTMEKAAFSLNNRQFTWEEGPNEIPVWLLIGQTPESFELPTLLTLRMNLRSGDYVDFFTDESPYEAVIIEFTPQGDSRVMEIY